MQRGLEIRFRLATILAAHWGEFVTSYGRWIRPVVFETIRKILACQTPALGCHLYRCACGETMYWFSGNWTVGRWRLRN